MRILYIACAALVTSAGICVIRHSQQPAITPIVIATTAKPLSTSPRDLRADASHTDSERASEPSREAFAAVQEKYAALVKHARWPPDVNSAVLQLLEMRERAANDYESERRTADLAAIEAQLAAVLHPVDYGYFQTLKDADASLQAVQEFREGLAASEPLNDAQIDAMLSAKFRQLERLSLLPDEQAASLDEFLKEVEYQLTPNQFQLLRDFELTELSHRFAASNSE